MTGTLRLNILLFQDRNDWVAQVLEHDMVAHGPTPHSALSNVLLVIQTHVNFDIRHERVPLSRLQRAADVYWRAFAAAKPLPPPERPPMMPPAIIQAAISEELLQVC